MKMDFGYHPRWLNVSSPEIVIETMADLDAIRSRVNASKQVGGKWLYMPLKDGGPEPVGRYQLPTTHSLALINETDEDMCRFAIIILGFLLGIRLLPAGWGHLHRTAIEQGAYSSFTPHDSEIVPCLKKALSFYKVNRSTRNVKRIQAAVTLLHWSQAQYLQFDEFDYLYKSMDACWAVCSDVHAAAIRMTSTKKRPRHAERPFIMHQILSVGLPGILNPVSAQTAATIRNDLLHEGLISDLPLGQDIIRPHCTVEIREFVEKAILALLGIRASYLATAGGDRMRHFLGMIP